MARSRNIKPGFFANEVLASLPHWTRLLFAGLWTVADREGRFEVRPRKIKRELFPDEDIDVSLGIEMLKDADPPFLTLYEADGRLLAQVLNWHKHQSPHHREIASVLPPPPSRDEASTMHEPCTDEASSKQGAPCPTDSGFLIPDSGYLIPDWLNTDLWAQWDRYRERLGKRTWTDEAKRLSIRKLEKLRDDGNDPRDVIEQSIANGYRGLFETRGKGNGQGKRGAAERVAAATRERVRRGQ